jgi:hypothetical protein
MAEIFVVQISSKEIEFQPVVHTVFAVKSFNTGNSEFQVQYFTAIHGVLPE